MAFRVSSPLLKRDLAKRVNPYRELLQKNKGGSYRTNYADSSIEL